MQKENNLIWVKQNMERYLNERKIKEKALVISVLWDTLKVLIES